MHFKIERFYLCDAHAKIGLFLMNSDNFIQKVADKITDLGLTGPAILLLEANKPLSFLGSQLLLVAQPTLDVFLPPSFTQQTINLLAHPEQIEQLITTLEAETQATEESSL